MGIHLITSVSPLRDVSSPSKPVGLFAEFKNLFGRYELFRPATVDDLPQKEPFDARKDAFSKQDLDRFPGLIVVRRFPRHSFKEGISSSQPLLQPEIRVPDTHRVNVLGTLDHLAGPALTTCIINMRPCFSKYCFKFPLG